MKNIDTKDDLKKIRGNNDVAVAALMMFGVANCSLKEGCVGCEFYAYGKCMVQRWLEMHGGKDE